MPKEKSSKICIKNGDNIYVFMWAIVGKNGDVMMGFPWKSDDSIESVIEKDGQFFSNSFVTKNFSGHSKISFHASGNYKLFSKIGKNENSIDRATVKGPMLTEINSPRRMVEILLPEAFPEKYYVPSNRDIVLDITGTLSAPSRCTIFCMKNEDLDKFYGQNGKAVDTSLWEAANALRTTEHAWLWVIRKSINDKFYGNKIYVTLIGDVKWGEPDNSF